MAECRRCGTDNPANTKFCGECGSALPRACPACGHPEETGRKFCGECGAALGSPSAGRPEVVDVRAPRTAPELRLVSVLFCDLVGYTALSERLDADEVRDLLSGYFDVARTIVARYGGEVGKFIGDAVMAVWGATTAGEDDAERAVRAALELVIAVDAYGEARHAPLQCRVGVVTGRAAVTETPGEGIVIGDRVNTASRAQSAAEPGQVLVDDATRLAAQAAIAFSDAGLHLLKGKAEPVRLWRAERAVAGAAGSLRTDGLEARFVGRDAELRLLKELFHACADRRVVRLVSVVGPAGCGKSRLLGEFRNYLDGLADTVMWHSGRCLPYGDGVAFSAIAEMVRQRFGIAEDEPPALAADKLAAGLERWVDRPDERAFLHPRLAQLLGVASAETDLSRDELFSGWRLFFERLTAHAPVALAVEDLHAADPGLLAFLEHLLDWAEPSPIFVLTFARTGMADGPEWSGTRHATVLNLDPLDDGSMATLLDDLVVDLPADVRQRIVGHAEGVPLFAVETVRSLIDRNLVVPRGGEYHLAGEVRVLDVPPTLTSLLSARLDSLPADERELVKALSVLGMSFSRATIDAATGHPPEDLERLLGALRHKEILSVRADPLSPDKGQYVFTQNLLRTVAYESLTRRERKARHLAAAAQLRRSFADDGADVVEVIAAHLDRALEVDPDASDAAELRTEAAAVHERAGRRAKAVGSPDLAIGELRRAAELSSDPASIALLHLEAGRAAITCGRFDEAVELAIAANARFDELNRAQDATFALTLRCRALELAGHVDQALALLEPAVASLPPDAADRAACDLLLTYGRVLVFFGQATDAGRVVDRAAAIAEGLDDRPLVGAALAQLALQRIVVHRGTEAAALLRAAIDTGLVWGEERGGALVNLGYVLYANDEPALDVLQQAVAHSRRVGDSRSLMVSLANYAMVKVLLGEHDEADAAARELTDGSWSIPSWIAYGHVLRTVIAARRGHIETARRHLELAESLRHCQDNQDRMAFAAAEASVDVIGGAAASVADRVLPLLSEAVAAWGVRSDAARQLWPDGIDSAYASARVDVLDELVTNLENRPRGHVPPLLRAVAVRGRGLLASMQGDAEGAETHLREAVDLFIQLDYPFYTAQAQLDLARLIGAGGPNEEAEILAKEARETLDRIGAVAPQLVG